ncbi:hypothetical protein C8Q80DRAFT_1274733 [Daedaleopsis nitida]|nr:hypothetical protein C8Q80DRAFT_1274733 [Daedaleopsis nitida]
MPEYIGKPPPWLLKKRKRQAEQRELSPAVPDPEHITPSRKDVFGSPAKSTRVLKTYAHKRARSYASSAAGEPEEDEDDESSDSSVDHSPTKPPHKRARISTKGPPSRRPSSSHLRRREEDTDSYAGLSHPTPSSSVKKRRRPSSPGVQIEPPRPPSPVIPTASAVDVTRAGRPRGRPPKVKPIAIPTPSTSSEESAALGGKRRTAAEFVGPPLTLSEALNRSFANASMRFAELGEPLDTSVSVKQKPGRPSGRGRGRGRGGASITRPASHTVPALSEEDDAPPAPSKRPRSRPHKSSVSEPSFPDPAVEETQIEDVEPTTPAKRPRGRPRKNTLPSSPPGRREGRSVSRGRKKTVRSLSLSQPPVSQQHLYDSVDVEPVVRALDNQAAQEDAHLHTDDGSSAPPKRGRGRPRGSKNKTTLSREASHPQRRTVSAGPATRVSVLQTSGPSPILPPNPVVQTPAKRPRGRPRKSAPTAETTVFPASETFDYMEPLKDPDEEDRNTAAGASTPRTRGRSSSRSQSRSRPRRNSAVVMVPPSPYYLDMATLQWRRREPTVSEPATPSSSPAKRGSTHAQAAAAGGTKEYQSTVKLCAALKKALLQAPMPKTRAPGVDADASAGKGKSKGKGKGKDKGKDKDDSAGTVVFRGSWAVLADPSAACDDSTALKTLHDIVRGIDACINLDNTGPTFSASDDGRTVAVAVPCGCLSIPGRALDDDLDSSSAPECAGEMSVSVAEVDVPGGFAGMAKAMRMTVTVTH